VPVDRDVLIAEGPDLYRFALSIVRDPDRAADLVQDTYVRAMEQEDRFDEKRDAGPWLRTILHNLAVDRARSAWREVVVEDVEERWKDDEYTIDPAVITERLQTRDDLEDALARIPFMYRTVVVLHDVDGWTVSRIADMQGVSLAAAKQRLRRGRMALTSAIAEGQARRHQLKGVPMRCWEARQHVSDYLDGAVDDDTRDLVESHLAACPTCPPLYASLVDTHRRLGDLRDPDTVVPPHIQDRIRDLVGG
jgi:RNA polymerase sigma-70 factor (ECF subfamily)